MTDHRFDLFSGFKSQNVKIKFFGATMTAQIIIPAHRYL